MKESLILMYMKRLFRQTSVRIKWTAHLLSAFELKVLKSSIERSGVTEEELRDMVDMIKAAGIKSFITITDNLNHESASKKGEGRGGFIDMTEFTPIIRKAGEVIRSEDWNSIQEGLLAEITTLEQKIVSLKNYIENMSERITLTGLESEQGALSG